MQMLEMLYDEIQDAVDRKVPFIIPNYTPGYPHRVQKVFAVSPPLRNDHLAPLRFTFSIHL